MFSKVKSYVSSLRIFFLIFLLFTGRIFANTKLKKRCIEAMNKATHFMVEKVSTNGGYVWYYRQDFSRRWGEMEAYKTMIWVQDPGTPAMGQLFIDAFHVIGDEYYWEAAEKTARALIWGQLECGGWNYMIDFAGDKSLKKWYNTIGKNGWRLEEFHSYSGNATFDDLVTTDAARFLLRMYLEKFEPQYRRALDKAINFILESQYPLGGWPQRYPLQSDYTSYYTFNDDVIWENIRFLIQCYNTLGREHLLKPILRAINFYLITLHGPPQVGWAQQYNMDVKPTGARTYEPLSLNPDYTANHIGLLLKFYQMTGETKFLTRIHEAINWLENCRLPYSMTENGRFTHARFIELGTNKPLFVHRRGSNVINGEYYVDYKHEKLLIHYGAKTYIDIDSLRREYNRIKNQPKEEITKDSPILSGKYKGPLTPQASYSCSLTVIKKIVPSENEVKSIIESMDKQGRWLVKHVMISNQYKGDRTKINSTDEFTSTFVGDETDTSPYPDETDRKYISTRKYINSMYVLLNYLKNK